ncbi:MAG: hypothetical protein ABL973_08520 [Micropepsaceae bacterium]
MDYLFFTAWQTWVGLFVGWGLPWSASASATAAAGVMFYFIGIAFKFLTSKEG